MTSAPLPHAADKIPIVTASNGQPFMPCDAVLALLRAIADSCRTLADDPDCDLRTAGAAIDVEADALEARAIGHTTETP
ncbi:hypothetical protein [Streptomyces swartbergensis]|uniref:Uncharacterized protein n=1 Tax=Streptomyces swartbergensis TaxID=487165 RepID=A0A243SAC1_9ACTN|nr:hypothetical protein [Streptomyces swartbergensis]OUD04674.1 hypothetical protein CA983_02650 [Streptomyces swartbergensis]